MNVNKQKLSARLDALTKAHPGLLRAPGPCGLTPQDKRLGLSDPAPKMQPSTVGYRAYHAGMITARQARALGCNVRGSGVKRRAA